MTGLPEDHWGNIDTHGNLIIATLNVNGLTFEKLQHIINHINMFLIFLIYVVNI